jgi:hypothetical protein
MLSIWATYYLRLASFSIHAPFASIMHNMDDFEDVSEEYTEAEEARKAYLDAIKQEWDKRLDNGLTAREIANDTKSKIYEMVPDALASMRTLAVAAVSESVKYQASKWLLENALLPNKAGSGDPLTELLEEMANSTADTTGEAEQE